MSDENMPMTPAEVEIEQSFGAVMMIVHEAVTQYVETGVDDAMQAFRHDTVEDLLFEYADGPIGWSDRNENEFLDVASDWAEAIPDMAAAMRHLIRASAVVARINREKAQP